MTQEFSRGMFPVFIKLCFRSDYRQLDLATGKEILERVLFGKGSWEELWEKHDFFHRYRDYLQVVVAAADKERSLKW